MRISIAVSLASFIILVALLRRRGVSLGLPIAYLASLLLLHVPGAVAHVFDKQRILTDPLLTRRGIIFTAIGAVFFVAGVALSNIGTRSPDPRPALRGLFWKFSVLAGGACTIIAYMIRLPSIGALLDRGGPIWMLGVLLALRSAFKRSDYKSAARWIAVMAIYPLLILMLTGFMSYGIAASIIIISGLAITAKRTWTVSLVSVVLLIVGIGVFLGYFQNRNLIRAAVWGGADTNARITAATTAFKGFRLFDPTNPDDLEAFDQRLNQNYFAGLAAQRIEAGQVSYLYGRSIVEGVQALIPRALWPDKPVVSGSPKLVSEMTGLELAQGTSFGVGNVMEFQINFGIPGLVIGFLMLGFALGRLDRLAAIADAEGDLGKCCILFLVAVALIQPNGSIVEIASGAAAGLAAGWAWKWAWERWPKPSVRKRVLVSPPVPQAP